MDPMGIDVLNIYIFTLPFDLSRVCRALKQGSTQAIGIYA